LQLLGEQERDWTTIGRELDGWKRDLDRRHDQLQKASDQIKQLKSDWDKEQASADYWLTRARSTKIVETAQASVIRTETLIDQTSTDLRNGRIAVVALQQAVNGQTARVLDVLDSVH